MKSSEVEALMRGVGSVLRELRDAQNKRADGVRDELLSRVDGLIGRLEKTGQQVAAMNGRISALERKLLAKD